MTRPCKWLAAVLIPLCGLTLNSCGDDDDEPNVSENVTSNEKPLSPKAQEIYNKLCNTTWTLISSSYDSSPLGSTITFSSTPVVSGVYKLYCSHYPDETFEWVPCSADEEGDLVMGRSYTVGNDRITGAFIVQFGNRVYLSFSGSTMTMTSTVNNKVYKYTQTPSGSGNDVEAGYEKPDVEFYDYTQQGKSSVKVDFIIYNKDEAGVTSASIKYGTSSSANSSASTSIVGKHVTATISGLKSNTKYYVKCTVKGKGGTVTTGAVAISLTSW